MFRHQVRRGLVVVATTVTATATALALAPASAADSAEDSTTAPPAPAVESRDGSTDADALVSTPAAKPAKRVRLRVGTRDVRIVHTNRVWATRVLREAGVQVRDADLVRVHRNGTVVRERDKRRVRDGDTIRVVRVSTRTRVKQQRIAPGTVHVRTAQLRPGVRKVARPGRPGVRRVKVTVKMHNATVVQKKRTGKVVRRPKPRRVLVGTAARSVPGADRLNWRALAHCESSGNPRAVNPAGYHGLYQFDLSTWRSVGGRGVPSRVAPAEQTYRAKLLYKQRGRQPWPHCGRYL